MRMLVVLSFICMVFGASGLAFVCLKQAREIADLRGAQSAASRRIHVGAGSILEYYSNGGGGWGNTSEQEQAR